MSEYNPQYPQTNLSIVEFYQKLGYKYKDWISEFNKYEDVMPVEQNQKGEEIPKDLQSNDNIQFITKTPTYPRYRGHTSFEYAQSLLTRQVLETCDTDYYFRSGTTYHDVTLLWRSPVWDERLKYYNWFYIWNNLPINRILKYLSQRIW